MLFMMEKHQAWAVEKGLNLTIPNEGELKELQDKQNE